MAWSSASTAWFNTATGWSRAVTPGPSVKRSAVGVAPGPRFAMVYPALRGLGATPPSPDHLKPWASQFHPHAIAEASDVSDKRKRVDGGSCLVRGEPCGLWGPWISVACPVFRFDGSCRRCTSRPSPARDNRRGVVEPSALHARAPSELLGRSNESSSRSCWRGLPDRCSVLPRKGIRVSPVWLVQEARASHSLEATATGMALGPRASQCHHPCRGPGAFRAVAPQRQHQASSPCRQSRAEDD